MKNISIAGLFFQVFFLLTHTYEFRCPVHIEWGIRARFLCTTHTKYFCLLNPLTMKFVENCTGPDWDRPGSKLVFQGNFNRKPCKNERYQPVKFLTHTNHECLFLKSSCSAEGQVVSNNSSSLKDTTCSCNVLKGYSFVSRPDDVCFCKPAQEDCSCFLTKGISTEENNVLADLKKRNCTYAVIESTIIPNAHERSHVNTTHSMTEDYRKAYVLALVILGIVIEIGMMFLVFYGKEITSFKPRFWKKRQDINREMEQNVVIEDGTSSTETEEGTNSEPIPSGAQVHVKCKTETKIKQQNSTSSDETEKGSDFEAMLEEVEDVEETLKKLVQNENPKRDVENLKKELEIIKENALKGDEDDVNMLIIKKLNRWKEEDVKFAITGESGVGKSSFINAFCGVNLAEVSIFGNTTRKKTEYTHPMNPKIKLVDLPGFGTPLFPKETYEAKMDLKSFDYVIIFVGNTPRQTDIEIALKLKELEISFCLVRSKFDEDLRRCGQIMTSKDIISKIKIETFKICEESNLTNIAMFIISSTNRNIGEFDQLISHMMKCLTDLKGQNVMLSLAGKLSKNMINGKYEMLKKRIPKVALEVGAIAATPLPGVDLVASIGLIGHELFLYYQTFGFGQDFMKEKRIRQVIERKARKDSLLLLSSSTRMFYTFALAQLGKWAAVFAVESTIDIFIPVLGSIVSAGTSIYVTKNFLHRMLESAKRDAEEIYDELLRESSQEA